MAVVGAEVTGSWFLTSGVVSFFALLLLLSIFLTALCSDCRRRSFELRDPEADKNPSSLIRVVRLEETRGARENPMIHEIQNDEKAFTPVEESSVTFTPWRSHLAAPQNHQGVQNSVAAVTTESQSSAGSNPEENSGSVTSWRSHLRAPQSRDPHHIYQVFGGGRSSSGGDSDASSSVTNQQPAEQLSSFSDLIGPDRNSVYAQVNKKGRASAPPGGQTPEQVEGEEEEEEEESSPPLPDRRTQLEG